MANYLETYKQVEERDLKPFVELLLLTSDEFGKRNRRWIKENLKRYGFQRDVRQGFTIEADEPDDVHERSRQRSTATHRAKRAAKDVTPVR